MTYPPDPVPAVPAPISADPVPAGQIPTQEEIQTPRHGPRSFPSVGRALTGAALSSTRATPNDPPKTIDAHQQSCRTVGFT